MASARSGEDATPAAQWAAYLGKQPIAAGERDWVGIDRSLDESTDNISRKQLLKHAREHEVRLNELIHRERLNAWYRDYLSLTAAIEQARNTNDRGGYERAWQAFEPATERLRER